MRTANPSTIMTPPRSTAGSGGFFDTFEKSAYLAYTATPFANIFIDEDEETDSFGEDLFPRSFIVSLRPPTNYTGVVRVFGLTPMSPQESKRTQEFLRSATVADNEAWLPDKHKKDWIPGDLPDSLVEATNAFLLAPLRAGARAAGATTRCSYT